MTDPGQEAVDFINLLTHTGDYYGVPFCLRPWQESFVRKLFGTLQPDGRRQYRKAFLAMGRKNGKTELAAAILLYLLLGTGKKEQHLYTASGDRKQAALIYEAAASMVRQSEELSAVCLIYDSMKRIFCEPLGSFYEALSSEAGTKHGLKPSVVVFDELHVLPNRKLYNALTTGFGARLEPLTLMITTAGWDRTSLAWEQWTYARAVRDGAIDDSTFLPVLYEAPADADWRDESVWHTANPGLGDFCSLETLRDECRQAQEIPAQENAFRQLHLNQWTEQAVRWLSTEAWAQCGEEFSSAELEGESCYAGLDLGVTGDLSVYAMAFPRMDGVWVLAHGWAPSEGSWRKEPANRDRYLAWAREGWLTLTPGNARDDAPIEEKIVEWNGRFPVRLLLGDRAYAMSLLIKLFNAHGINVKGIPQGPVALNEAMVCLETLLLAGMIHHGGNPLLAWAVANAVVRINHTGLKCLDKSQATERIDALSALVMALAGMVSDPNSQPSSIYERRGVLTL